MTSTASTALNPGSNALAFTSATSSDTFHVRILLKHAASTKSTFSSDLSSGNHLEVIPLRIVSTISALHAQVLSACQRPLEGGKRNGQTLLMVKDAEGKMLRGGGNSASRVVMVGVVWEADSRGRETCTYGHEGNVEGLLRLLRETRGCNDVVVVEVDT